MASSISVFDIFRVGIGPSSSHTVGPMRAAEAFIRKLEKRGLLEKAARVRIDLMGSLGATGRGHATDTAAVLGLTGETPDTVDIEASRITVARIREEKQFLLAGKKNVAFDWEKDLKFSPEKVARYHTNAMDFSVLDEAGNTLLKSRYYSTGGGFIVPGSEEDPETVEVPVQFAQEQVVLPYRYRHMADLMALAGRDGKNLPDIVRENERVWRTDEEIDAELDRIWEVMTSCMDRGQVADGVLPGAYRVARRAKAMRQRLLHTASGADPLSVLDWVCTFAFAVSEENAAGGRLVTAPTNGAAGVIPAVLEYYCRFVPGADQEGVRKFLLTAGAIGILFKTNASISGAEVGCQGEVGVACSMAAAGLTAVLGGNIYQIENAAEIGIEHHLGLTCDPVAGQVQLPCIERNAMAAVQAVAAARLSMAGNGRHYISLDQAIQTMLETGRDMSCKYKETSAGGLAVCIVEC